MSHFLKRLCVVFFIVAAVALAVPRAFGDDWLPVSQDELKMTSEPKAPGAPAIYLYRQVDRDDNPGADKVATEIVYFRLKVLTEDGRKYANVEIPFDRDAEGPSNIKARVVKPDGSVVRFDGKVYEKTIIKARGFKYLAKTFTVPDVQIGDIIEYRYTNVIYSFAYGAGIFGDVGVRYLGESQWILSSDLFTKRAKFSLKRFPDAAISWSWPVGLPAGAQPPRQDGDCSSNAGNASSSFANCSIRMDVADVPAFQEEDYMPPAEALRFRVVFRYTIANTVESDPGKFWQAEVRQRNKRVEEFLKGRKSMEQIVSQTVSPNDPPQVKLQKLYDRVQQVRNISYEVRKTDAETKRAKEKFANSVEEVWKSGGYAGQINELYIALARAAGFDAYRVVVSTRDRHLFNPKMMNPLDLNGDLVLVKVNGQDLFLDPGVKFAPFGLLPWPKTGVQGFVVNKDGGTQIQTPVPGSSFSSIDRKAELALDDSGNLDGKVTLTFSGMNALSLRLEERNGDDAGRKKFLEDLLRETIASAGEVELTNKPDWTTSSQPLVAEYHVKVPGWVSGSGKHVVFTLGIFGAREKHVFEHAERVYDVYFDFPYQENDDINVSLPAGWKVEAAPPPSNVDARAAIFQAQAQQSKGGLHITRTLRSEMIVIEAKQYPTLRHFFQTVRAGDEQQVVLLSAK